MDGEVRGAAPGGRDGAGELQGGQSWQGKRCLSLPLSCPCPQVPLLTPACLAGAQGWAPDWWRVGLSSP